MKPYYSHGGIVIYHGPSVQANFKGADFLRDATRYLARAFRMNFTRDEAQANLEARGLPLRAENSLINEAEAMIPKQPRSAA